MHLVYSQWKRNIANIFLNLKCIFFKYVKNIAYFASYSRIVKITLLLNWFWKENIFTHTEKRGYDEFKICFAAYVFSLNIWRYKQISVFKKERYLLGLYTIFFLNLKILDLYLKSDFCSFLNRNCSAVIWNFFL